MFIGSGSASFWLPRSGSKSKILTKNCKKKILCSELLKKGRLLKMSLSLNCASSCCIVYCLKMFHGQVQRQMCRVLVKSYTIKTVFSAIFTSTLLAWPNDATHKKLLFIKRCPLTSHSCTKKKLKTKEV